MLEVDDLQVTYNRTALGVQGVSLEVREQEVVAVLGANGAGKSTTLRAVSGFLPSDFAEVTRGHITFTGQDLRRLPPHRRVNLGIGLVPERDKVFRNLTVDENLRVSGGRRAHVGNRDLLELIFDLFPPLFARRKVRAGYLSGGERQMLGIARALTLNPRLLLADEVSLGIAPNLVTTLLDALRRINETQGTSVLVVEQNAAAAFRVADYVYVMETGRVVTEGRPETLLAQEEVRSAYFGLSDRGDGKSQVERLRSGRVLGWG